jgi:endonuclease/exonuclease/phosphatase family metal-dependent hydrolase
MNKFFFIILIFNHLLPAQNLNDLEFGTDATFDLVSWNIEWFPKNNNTSSNVQDILANLEADIYALQEIEDTTLLKQIVSNIPDYECYFKSSYYGGLAYVYNTNTIQVNSKYEIFTSNLYWNTFPRSPQVLDFTFLGDEYIIINNHFKCCGDGILDVNNSNDEENRRLQAITLLKQFIDDNFSSKRVILLGDLNDNLTDNADNNIFQDFINDTANYLFTDMQIAQGNSIDWSYPTWPSHLDHILITNELFDDFQNFNSLVSVIRIDDYMSGWNNYENNVSDHRPIGLKLDFNTVNYITEVINQEQRRIKVVNILGVDVIKNTSGLILEFYDDGTVKKKFILK